MQDEIDRFASSRRIILSTAAGRTLMHFVTMYTPEKDAVPRNIMYREFDVDHGTWGPPVDFPDPFLYLYPGFPDMAITGDNRALIGAHSYVTYTKTVFRPFAYWQDTTVGTSFPVVSYPPDSVVKYAAMTTWFPMWPHIGYTEGPDDTILHMFLQRGKSFQNPTQLCYLRRFGSDRDPAAYWEYPPKIVDTNYAWTVHQMAVREDGRVALVYAGNVPCEGDPDTVSGYECTDSVEWNHDLFVKLSYDYGDSFPITRNITRYSSDPESVFRVNSEISAIFDESGELHVIWADAAWPRRELLPTEVLLSAGALRHWSENSDSVSLVYDFNWNQTVCDGGYNKLNVADVSLAECRGLLYVMFAQFNDPAHGIMDECGISTYYPHGAAVADLWVTVSSDDGLHWDTPRNITNSHTPGCDSIGGIGGPCAHEIAMSITARGSNVFIDPAVSGADVIVPAGGVDPGWYLDAYYVDDPSPEAGVSSRGYLQYITNRWFRLACVDPILTPALGVSPDSLGYPVYAPHCGELSVPIELKNLGNGPAGYTIATEELTGPAGWLAAAGFDGSLPPDPSARDTGYAVINAGGTVCAPGTVVALSGRLRIDSNDPLSPHYVAIDILVADTVWTPSLDTLTTGCLALAVRNDGGAGARGEAGVGLDFSGGGDCDPYALRYLNDVSPLLLRTDPGDTAIGWSVYGCGYPSPWGLIPLGNTAANYGEYSLYESLSSTTDTSLCVQTTWYAPSHPDSCRFVIQRSRIFGGDMNPHTISAGQLVDWDIPSDSGARNGSDTLDGLPVIFQTGGEFHQDPGACQDNDRRFGGAFPLGMYLKASEHESLAVDSARLWAGAATRANSEWVTAPACGLDPAALADAMRTPAWSLYEPPVPESALVDLHTLITFVSDFSLPPEDTLVVYTGFVVVQDGDTAALRATAELARAWFCGHLVPDPPGCGCCRVRGDANHDGTAIISDVTYLVSFLFRGGPAPVCEDEADTNGDGTVIISDLTYLVTFLFRGGAPMPEC